MRPLSRPEPALPVEAVKTYSAVAPLATHWREASCEEAACQAFEHGWVTAVDETSDLGRRQAHYIRRVADRRYRERDAGGHTEFTFEAGQRCFRTHQVPLERDPVFLVRAGDWRGYGPTRMHVRPGDWLEDMQESLDRVRSRHERG